MGFKDYRIETTDNPEWLATPMTYPVLL